MVDHWSLGKTAEDDENTWLLVESICWLYSHWLSLNVQLSQSLRACAVTWYEQLVCLSSWHGDWLLVTVGNNVSTVFRIINNY